MNKVLLVEDDPTTNFISRTRLKEAGIHDIEEVINGKEALDRISISCPDFIFLDIKMPVMDGWDFLREKLSLRPCNKVKIAMLSSSSHPRDVERASQYPCVIEYLEKPLTKEKIEALKVKIHESKISQK